MCDKKLTMQHNKVHTSERKKRPYTWTSNTNIIIMLCSQLQWE